MHLFRNLLFLLISLATISIGHAASKVNYRGKKRISRSLITFDVGVLLPENTLMAGVSTYKQKDRVGFKVHADILFSQLIGGFREGITLLYFPHPSVDNQIYFGLGCDVLQYNKRDITEKQGWFKSSGISYYYHRQDVRPTIVFGCMEERATYLNLITEVCLEYLNIDLKKHFWTTNFSFSFKIKLGF